MRKTLLPLAETVRFRAPAGFGAMLSGSAAMDCSTMSDFIRRACLEKLRATAPAPAPHQPAANDDSRNDAHVPRVAQAAPEGTA
jgi:hypothetical protein